MKRGEYAPAPTFTPHPSSRPTHPAGPATQVAPGHPHQVRNNRYAGFAVMSTAGYPTPARNAANAAPSPGGT